MAHGATVPDEFQYLQLRSPRGTSAHGASIDGVRQQAKCGEEPPRDRIHSIAILVGKSVNLNTRSVAHSRSPFRASSCQSSQSGVCWRV